MVEQGHLIILVAVVVVVVLWEVMRRVVQPQGTVVLVIVRLLLVQVLLAVVVAEVQHWLAEPLELLRLVAVLVVFYYPTRNALSINASSCYCP
jgi:hypothetical protein